jgi:TonB family protein
MASAAEPGPFLEAPKARGPLVGAFILSALMHLLLVYLAPPLGLAALPHIEYTEVELLRMPEAPPIVRRLPPPAPPPRQPLSQKLWRTPEGKTVALLEKRALEALRRARTESLGATLAYPGLLLKMPKAQAEEASKQVRTEEALLLQESLARTGKALAMPGVPKGRELLGQPGLPGKRKPFALASPEARKLARSLLEAELAREPAPRAPAREEAISGPAALRQVLFRPATPKVTVERETTVLLKFWVRSDGTVGRVVPLRKGDPRLEAVAVRYLKGWRFNPLQGQEEEQWGTIPIVFRRP